MKLMISLTETEWRELSAVAAANRRPLRDQAAFFVAEGLKRGETALRKTTKNRKVTSRGSLENELGFEKGIAGIFGKSKTE